MFFWSIWPRSMTAVCPTTVSPPCQFRQCRLFAECVPNEVGGFLSYSLVGKAFTVRSVCAGEAHVLSGWGPVHFPRQETVCPLVLCHSKEVPHLHPSVSSGRKLWVICASETVIPRVSVFLCRFHFRRIGMCTKSFTPSHKGVWWRARTVAPDLSHIKPMLWDFLWMPLFSRKYRVRWAHMLRGNYLLLCCFPAALHNACE